MSRDLITFRCPQCQAALSLPASMAGATGPCLYCETEIIGPKPEIGQPAQLAAPAAPEPPPALVTQEPTAPAPAMPAPLEISEPAAPSQESQGTSAPDSALPFPFPAQSPAPQPQAAPAASAATTNLTQPATAAVPGFTDVIAPPADSVAPTKPEFTQPEPTQPFSQQQQTSVPPDPFAQQAAPATPFPPKETDPAIPTDRSSSETSSGASPAPIASLPPLARQTNPLSPEPEQHEQPQAQPTDPFGQQQPPPQATDPFGQQPQPQAPAQGEGFPADHREIPPHPAAATPAGFGASTPVPVEPAPQRPWQDATLPTNLPTNLPTSISKLPGGNALRGLVEKLRTSPLAPLAIAGTLVVLLIVFGIYLFRDYKEIVPDAATSGTTAASPTPTPTPAVDPATATTPAPDTPAVDPVATTTTPVTSPAPTTPATTPNPGTDPATDPNNTAATSTTPPPATTPETAASGSGLLDGPVATLQAFLNSATWQERLNHSLHPEIVRPLMEIYYRNYPDEVVLPESTRFQHSETDPDTGKRFFVFHVTTVDAPDGFPVLIEETSDGLKVDWETFAEFKDNLFQRFANNPSAGKLGAFHLIMRNAHYFGEEFPELKGLTPYRLDPPIPNQETYAFALTDSVVNKELQSQVTWGMNFTPFLELRWAKSQNGADYLQVVSVLHTNWRNRQ